ncbi:MAG TPA: DUF4382 domain-containing protein [Candidatus Acidoferrum sp.]|nr:DUF4382 domain-containing protein [Candidatus Acidoferrum sp.]
MLAPDPLWLQRHPISLLLGCLVIAAALIVIGCGGGPSPMQALSSGTVTVSLSDPPSCAAPTGATAAGVTAGTFSNAWVTIVSVKAHISATADAKSSGWQELAPQLNSAPMQVDLLHLPSQGQCLLAQLGSAELPAGDYQQIRLILLANAATSMAPSSNNCAQLGNVFNCVAVPNPQNPQGPPILHELKLASEAQTGLKIPPGQMMGGPLHVAAGQSVDLNIDFDACSSITPAFTLKPALTAGVVSPNMTGISGQIVDSVTSKPIVGATVTLQSPDMTGVDRIGAAPKMTDSTGHFRFCPLPGQAFDVVVDAMTSSGTAYDATAIFNVTGGTDLGAIPLVAETPATSGGSTGPGTIQGAITAINGTTGATIDANVSALQTVMVSGASHTITVPLFASSNSSVSITSSTSCPMGAPKGAFCASYTLLVPASNPEVGTFSAGKVTLTAPASGDVLYTVEADATNPTTNAAMCSPSSQTTSKDTGTPPAPLKVTPGATTTAAEMDFSGCS